MQRRKLPENLESYIRQEAERLGYYVVDMAMKGGYKAIIEIILDKSGGITLDECGSFNRNVSRWIEDNNGFAGDYMLDVCSPGLDRELRSDRDLLWALGREVCINTFEPVEGKRRFVGKLLESGSSDEITIEETVGHIIRLKKSQVSKARLYDAKLFSEA
jgi:ribosome maturation factor RimP